MNKKAEAFQNYLDADENKKTAFQREEVKEDTQKTVVFRSHIVVEGQQLPTVVILDDSVFSMIRIQVSPQAKTEENELKVLKMANEFNLKYKPFKLYFDAAGSLILDVCLLTPGEDFSELGDEIYGMFDVLINFLNESYRPIMKEIW
ncbi:MULTISPECIES: hypothetical protein [Selenomonas]|uniref:YbjN domain-containing protein n=1 Tax=Selenomonas ruminis TaxID=2593411 RepID=A0A5D6VZW5_9FIRM|nr:MULTISPECIES: hypothetical protein [unclassified Selenomonas]MBQ1867052.1 hypothetical protein [Selenomonas sp.]TYZ21150.1 hypothetical protein FZ040_10880 [Selenomonas sp. mPRGC5]